MKRTIIYITLMMTLFLTGWGTMAQPVQAQGPDIDETLAKASGTGILLTLVRPELTDTQNFYLAEGVNINGIVTELGTVISYNIIETGWVSETRYQTTAVVQPGDRTLILYSAKHNGRWQVEGLELVSVTGSTESNIIVEAPTVVVSPMSENGEGIIVFQTSSGGDIYRINADGTGLQWVTTGLDPQLSPDGTQIAFTRWEPRYELFTINIDGTNEQAWTHGWRQMKSPTWSADGQTITFSYQQGGRLNEQEFSVDLLKLGDDGFAIPEDATNVERDGTIIEYTLPADTYWLLMQVDLSTGTLTNIGSDRYSYGPTGHPTEGGQLIYKAERGIALNETSTGIDTTVSTDFNDRTPVISPDGQTVAVSYWQNDHWEIHTMNIDGSNRQRLTETPLSVLAEGRTLTQAEVDGALRYIPSENPAWNNAAPTWSPDGNQIAFLTDRMGEWEIWVMNADGSEQRPMFNNGVIDDIPLNYAGVDERMLSWQ